MSNTLDQDEIETARGLVRSALASQIDEPSRQALTASLKILDALTPSSLRKRSGRFAGNVEHTFFDEDHVPNGREIDVRVHYSWSDYDPTDDPSSYWGATIEEVELIAVRYLNHQGEATTLGEHHRDLCRHLLNTHDDRLLEVCTSDGYRKGVGRAPNWYIPAATGNVDFSPAPSLARMARSVSTRAADQPRRQLG